MVNRHRSVLFSVLGAAALSSLVTHTTLVAETVPEGTTLKETQTLVRNNGTEPQSLDPHLMVGVPESNLARDLFEGLTITSPDGEIIPGVATDWKSNDGRIWTFHLREDAKWSNGDPVTAHDFVYSWQRVADPKTASPYSSFLDQAHLENATAVIHGEKPVESLGIKALDAHTLEIHLTESIPYFPKLTAHTTLMPVHAATINAHGEKWTQPDNIVGNGAYQLSFWRVNDKIVLTRNLHYWDNQNTIINEVTFLPIASEITDLNFYRSGMTDIAATVPIDLFHRVKKELGDELHINPKLCTYYYEMNHEAEVFNDPKVREALKITLNRDIIVNRVKNHGERKAYGLTPPYTSGMGEYAPAWFEASYQEQAERAKALLKEAGYSKSNPLRFEFLYNTSEGHKKIAIAVASIWKQSLDGMVEMTLTNQEWKTFLDRRYGGHYEMSSSGWCADYDEPSSFLNMLKSDSSINTARYKSEAFDRVMEEAVLAKTEDERSEMYKKAERVLDQESAILPIYYYVSARLIKPYVGGYSNQNTMDGFYTKDLYLKEPATTKRSRNSPDRHRRHR